MADAPNEFQIEFIRSYDGGEYAYVLDEDAGYDVDGLEAVIEDAGDTFLLAGYRELKTSEGCDSPEEAVRRITVAGKQFYESAARMATALDARAPDGGEFPGP